MPVAFAEPCRETKLGDAVRCPEMTKVPGLCVVERAMAFDICAETPGCKYVATTSNAKWNIKFSNAAMLGKDPLSHNPEWKSCELPATTRTFNPLIASCVWVTVDEYALCAYVCMSVFLSICMHACAYVCASCYLVVFVGVVEGSVCMCVCLHVDIVVCIHT